MATLSDIGIKLGPNAGKGILRPHRKYTISLIEMLYSFEVFTDRPAYLAEHYTPYYMDDCKEQLSTRTEADIIDSTKRYLTERVCPGQELEFVQWAIKRFNLEGKLV